MPNRESEAFLNKVEELKKPREAGEGTDETRDIVQAMDIISALRNEVFTKNPVAWEKLLGATEHLSQLLKRHLGPSEEEPK